MLCLVTNIKSFLIFPHLGSPKPDPAFQLFMNTWWYYYYSALLQINWNCHKALKSFSPNPVLLHSFVLKIAAAILQFPLDFIPLSNICIQSYNFPGLLVKYIINMRLGSWLGIMGIMPSRHRLWFHQQQQQDLNALLSQSLKANSNS